MPRASKRPVNKQVKVELQDNFAFLISTLSKSSDIQQFFEVFLTEEEKIMLSKRLMLHLMLENRYLPSEIVAVLSLSRETIRTHKVTWMTGGKVYKYIIATIAARRKTKQFWKNVEKFLRPLEYALQAKSDMKARAKLFSGDFDDV